MVKTPLFVPRPLFEWLATSLRREQLGSALIFTNDGAATFLHLVFSVLLPLARRAPNENPWKLSNRGFLRNRPIIVLRAAGLTGGSIFFATLQWNVSPLRTPHF